VRAVSVQKTPNGKPENVWLSLIFNIALPGFILIKLSGSSLKEGKEPPFYVIGPVWALVIACAIPAGYGVYDYLKRRQINFFSVLGLGVILVNGVFGLLKLPAVWYACSEATVPLMFAGAFVWTARWTPPLVQRFMLNPQVFDIEKVKAHLAEKGNEGALVPLMHQTSYLFAGTMVVNAALNFALALFIIRSDPYQDYGKYTQEVGMLRGFQWTIMVPVMVLTFFLLFWVIRRLGHLTGVDPNDLMVGHAEKEGAMEKD